MYANTYICINQNNKTMLETVTKTFEDYKVEHDGIYFYANFTATVMLRIASEGDNLFAPMFTDTEIEEILSIEDLCYGFEENADKDQAEDHIYDIIENYLSHEDFI